MGGLRNAEIFEGAEASNAETGRRARSFLASKDRSGREESGANILQEEESLFFFISPATMAEYARQCQWSGFSQARASLRANQANRTRPHLRIPPARVVPRRLRQRNT